MGDLGPQVAQLMALPWLISWCEGGELPDELWPPIPIIIRIISHIIRPMPPIITNIREMT